MLKIEGSNLDFLPRISSSDLASYILSFVGVQPQARTVSKAFQQHVTAYQDAIFKNKRTRPSFIGRTFEQYDLQGLGAAIPRGRRTLSEGRFLMDNGWRRRWEASNATDFGTLNQLGEQLDLVKARILIAFVARLAERYRRQIPAIHTFLDTLQELGPIEKAARLRTWLALRETEELLRPIQDLSVFQAPPGGGRYPMLPPEAIHLRGLEGSACRFLTQLAIFDRYVDSIIAIAQHVGAPNNVEYAVSVLAWAFRQGGDNLTEFVRELMKFPLFSNLSDNELANSIWDGGPVDALEAGITSGPSGVFFLRLAISRALEVGDWDRVFRLIEHPRIWKTVECGRPTTKVLRVLWIAACKTYRLLKNRRFVTAAGTGVLFSIAAYRILRISSQQI